MSLLYISPTPISPGLPSLAMLLLIDHQEVGCLDLVDHPYNVMTMRTTILF